MIKTLYDIGVALSSIEKFSTYFKLWENPFEEGKVVVMNLDSEMNYNGNLGIGEDKKDKNLSKYLFKSFKKGANVVPTFYLTKTGSKHDPKKLFDKLVKCIENYHFEYFRFQETPKSKRKAEISDRYKNLFTDLSKFQFNNKENYLVTINIDGKWLGEIDYFKSFFSNEALKNHYTKNYGGPISSIQENKLCSITNKEDTVYGFVDTLGFTVNDNSFMRNGFDQGDAYKMFPVSPESVQMIEGAKKVVSDIGTRKFYGLKYIILPRFIAVQDDSTRRSALKYFFRNTNGDGFESSGLSIIHNEEILHAVTQRAELQNGICYDIMFYQQQQAQFLIKVQLSDVMPSRLKKIFEEKTNIEKTYRQITKIKIKEKNENPSKISFGLIKNYFSKKIKKNNKDVFIYQPYFFKIIEAVFYGNFLNEKEIIKAFIRQIRLDFKQQNEEGKSNTYIRRTKDAFVIYQFFKALGLFKNRLQMEEKEKQSVSLTTEGFIDQHSDFFDSEYKKGVFRLGNLSAYLMGKQYKKLNNTPFMKQLNSLRIDEKTITKILPKLISKLREYETALPELEQSIAKSLVHPNKLSKDEISYTFTLGLVMQREFSKAYRQNQEEEE